MKYLLQPIPKSNPYAKDESLNPYSPLNTKENSSHSHTNLLTQPALRLFCQSCKKQLTHQLHTIVQDQETCVGCLATLETMPSSYQIVEKLDYPLFEPSWTAYQEVLLLDSLDKWGFGNWKDVQEYMEYFGAKFTQDQIETHYNTFYLCDKNFLPRFNSNLIERKKQLHNCKSLGFNQVSIVSLTTNLREDSMNYVFEQIDDFSHEAPITPMINETISTSPHIKGYNSCRKQFQTDYDEHAEKNIANLEFRDDDLPDERDVKFRLILEYNERLKKRYEIHDFIIEHRLLDTEYQKDLEETRNEYQKQAADELVGFMRFSTFNVHTELVRRLALEKQLKSIIEGMRSYRRISNTGRLKQTFELVRKQSKEAPATPSRSRGRPRKIIHLENSQKSTASNSDWIGSKKVRNADELFRRMKIKTGDLKCIVKEAAQKKSGEGFRYKDVEVMVVQRK